MESLDELQHSFQSLIEDIEKNLDRFANLDLLLQSHSSPTTTTVTLSESLRRALQDTINNYVKRPLEEWLEKYRRPALSQDNRECRQYERTGENIGTSGQRKKLPGFITSKPAKPLSLGMHEMGPGMISAVAQIIKHPEFCGKVPILGLKDYNLVDILKDAICPEEYSSLAIKYGSDNGIPRLYLEEDAPFKLPDFSALITKPSNNSILRYIQGLLDSPPTGYIPYYVGPALNKHFNDLLDPGHLRDLGHMAGINSLYWHAGDKGSGTAVHCEDARMRSGNLTIYGYKLWILIKESDTSRFENYVHTLCGCDIAPKLSCDQWIRHQSLLITPKELETAGVKFDLICASPGDLVITAPRQYYAVVNITPCFAVSINFVLPDEPAISPIRTCSKCGLHEFDHINISPMQTLESQTSNVEKQAPTYENSALCKRAIKHQQPQRFKSPEPVPSIRHSSPSASDSPSTPEGSVTCLSPPVSSQGSFLSEELQLTRGDRTQSSPATPSDNSLDEPLAGSRPSSPGSTMSQTSLREHTAALSSPVLSPSALQPPDQGPQVSLRGLLWPLRSLPTPSALRLEVPGPETCSPAPVLTLKRISSGLQDQRVLKRARGDDIEEIKQEILHIDKKCNIPVFKKLAPPHAHVMKLAAVIRSRHAIQHFCDEVNARREPNPEDISFERPADTAGDTPQQYEEQFILNAVNRLLFLTRRDKHSAAVTRIHQYLLAKVCDKAKMGSLRIDSTIKRKILEVSGLTNNQYDWHLSQGKKWVRVCGKFDGLLCFIFPNRHNPFHITPLQYIDMEKEDLRIFHALLDDEYTTSICSAGKAFQQSLGADDVHFKWESPSIVNICDLPEKELLAYLQPFESQETNAYDQNEFRGFQSNPTVISGSDSRMCDFCDAQDCDCIHTRLPSMKPRIKRYDGKGLGLQAVSPHPGAIVYEKGALLGFLTGKLKLPGMRDKEMVVELDDYQIVCSEMGSCFRLLNHACDEHAVAKLKKRKVSGHIMMAVEALQNIRNGSEITICYGSGCNLDCQTCADSFPRTAEQVDKDGSYKPEASKCSRASQNGRQVTRARTNKTSP